MPKRLLPKYVTEFVDRHGRVRTRFRRKGFKDHYFQSPFGTEDFRTELRDCLDGGKREGVGIERLSPGTIDDLVSRYFMSGDFKSGRPMTQRKNRGILENFRDRVLRSGKNRVGDLRVIDADYEALDRLIAEKAENHPAAARNLRKQLRRLFAFSVKIRMRSDNPVEHTAKVRIDPSNTGFHEWTEAEIDRFRSHWALGTKPRLAMEMLLWTDQRRSDMVRMGRHHVKDGRIRTQQDKGGKVVWIPIAPQLKAAIDAMLVAGHQSFLVTSFGKPFTSNGFGNRFREWCNEAGLPNCSAHGLRKAMARRIANLGGSNAMLKAVGGWSSDGEVSTYTKGADQIRLADKAIGMVAEWEMVSDLGKINEANG